MQHDEADIGDDAEIGDEPDEDVRFRDLGLSDTLLAALDELGYDTPTPIQAETIPPLLDGFDLLGQAATGTGKTAAFALPMLDRVLGAGRSPVTVRWRWPCRPLTEDAGWGRCCSPTWPTVQQHWGTGG